MFKSVEQILEPDERHAIFRTPDGQVLTLQLHHADVARMELGASVPEDVRQVFDRARNAFVYSWYDYDLGGLAELLAFGALEQALKGWAGVAADKRSPGLDNLYQRAVDQGVYPPDPAPPHLPAAKLVAHVRNQWAHGTTNIHDPGTVLNMLIMCVDRINRLYAADADS